MPIETFQDPDQPFDAQVVRGALNAEEVLAAQRHYYKDSSRATDRPLLWDVREVKGKSDFQEIFRMVEDSTGLWSRMSGGKTAILVKSNRDASGARLFVKLAEAMPRDIRVFTSYQDAVTWLTSQNYPGAVRAS